MQGDGNDLVRGIEHGHSACAQLGQVGLVENQCPGVHRGLFAEQGFDLVLVITDAGGTPHVGGGVAVAGVVALQLGEHLRVEVGEVGQLAAIKLGQYAGLDQVGQQVAAGEHHVIAAAPGHQLALHHVAVVEHVINRGDARGLLEFLGGVRRDVVVPVVDVHAGRGGFSCLSAGSAQQCGQGQG
ncbi:hypothetical protein D3C76_708910 [compost metagenome]